LLLKEKGTLVLSVPHSDAAGVHVEHFPELINTELLLGERPRLIGTLSDGRRVEFSNLVFHGGIGSTLEYRIFSFQSLRAHILDAGLTKFKTNRNFRALGIVWEKWSRIWIAEK